MNDNSKIPVNTYQRNVKWHMKILVLVSYFSTNINDPGDFTSDFVQGLKKKRFEILIIAPHLEKAKFHEFIKGIEIFRFPYFFPFRYQELAYGSGIPYNIQKSILAKIQIVPFVISELITTVLIIRKHQIYLINSHWFVPQGFIGAICKKIFNLHHIVTIHSSEITLLKKIPLGSYIANFIISNSDVIISVSEHRVDELISFASPKNAEGIRKKLKIIPMGADLPEVSNQNSTADIKEKLNIKAKSILLFIGRLVEVKGCEYLIESMEEIVNVHKDSMLIIVGIGPLEEKLKQIALKKNLNLHIRFEGFVDHSKIGDYYAIADIVIIPSIIDSSGFQEGLPVVLLEAFSMGKPVIGSKIKGIQEIVHDGYNGILVDPKNSIQLAERISNLLRDITLQERLSKNAKKTATNFSWDVIIRKYTDIITELNSDRKTGAQ